MKTMLSSASRVVFILLSLGAVIGFFIGKLQASDFMLLAAMAFSFYFSKPVDPSTPVNQTTGSPTSISVVGK